MITNTAAGRALRLGSWPLCLALGAALLPGCGPTSKVATSFGGKGIVEAIEHTDQVQAIRLKSQRAENSNLPEVQRGMLDDYQTVGATIEVSPEVAKKLSAILVSSESYRDVQPKTCDRDYVVRLSFGRSQKRIDVLLSFACSDLAVFSNGRPCGSADFKPAHDSLLAEIKMLFPDDKAIQALQP